jgi:hypothetical protein
MGLQDSFSGDSFSRRTLVAGLTATAAASLPSLATAASANAAPSTSAAAAVMSRERYLQYANWFNANDPRFLEFYHPDVVLWLGNATLRGGNAIHDFYNDVKAHIHETVQVTHFVSDPTGIAAELPSEFKVYKDWPLPNYFNRPLKAGEVFRIISLVLYQIENGKFRDIKSARFKIVNDWQMEG